MLIKVIAKKIDKWNTYTTKGYFGGMIYNKHISKDRLIKFAQGLVRYLVGYFSMFIIVSVGMFGYLDNQGVPYTINSVLYKSIIPTFIVLAVLQVLIKMLVWAFDY
jgi:hypothetical protein